MRRLWAWAIAVLVGCGPAAEPAPLPVFAEAPRAPSPSAEVPASTGTLFIDTHADTTQRMLDMGDDLSSRLPNGHVDLPRMREGGLSAIFLSIWVDPRRYHGEEGWARALALVRTVRDFAAAHPDDAALCTTAGEVRAAHASGRIALLMGLEGAHALGDADDDTLIARLGELHALGVRYVTVTWTGDNRFGHASTGGHASRGLTPLGRRLVREMNRLGVIVDVSHVSDRTAHDVLDVTTRPVLASHSATRALSEHVRNVPDDLIRRIAAGGGAVCVNFYAHFLDADYGVRRRALEHDHHGEFAHLRGRSWQTATERNAIAARIDPALRPPAVRVLADHLAHVVEVGGEGAACLGSDFDGISELPEGMQDVADLPRLVEELTSRELPVAAIGGENVLRVLSAQTE
ncbi:dipeptidase [Sandaracinus amylolyticus]|uniref:dipeptidase n=1 Tax=Sandaracinus amylolyticus TaxID=927083 RepID=UPI001F44E233|nr:dipeptidase [Sandaracinus amylolyticus]UJR86531.1 Hypothetical protein I5071_86260 [Sandaracinus amylolyticus]